ncbi:MAG: hypothetical protein K0U36_01900, partial [Alphaproteobacteria bacterium]|nr:hypothetical protein [Alphaproteobacteria bacterium]
AENRYQVKQPLFDRVFVQRHNLLSNAPPAIQTPDGILGAPFDIVFCRNVLVYMQPSVVQGVIGRLSSWMQPKGFLALGGVEAANYRHFRQSAATAPGGGIGGTVPSPAAAPSVAIHPTSSVP